MQSSSGETAKSALISGMRWRKWGSFRIVTALGVPHSDDDISRSQSCLKDTNTLSSFKGIPDCFEVLQGKGPHLTFAQGAGGLEILWFFRVGRKLGVPLDF